MKKFLTKNEACSALKQINSGALLNIEDTQILSSIRACLLAEELGISLWGKIIEDARPLFRKGAVPSENASEDAKENYESYKKSFSEAYKEIIEKGE